MTHAANHHTLVCGKVVRDSTATASTRLRRKKKRVVKVKEKKVEKAKLARPVVSSLSTAPGEWEVQWRRQQQAAITPHSQALIPRTSSATLQKAREELRDSEAMAHWRIGVDDRRQARRNTVTAECRPSARDRLDAVAARVRLKRSA